MIVSISDFFTAGVFGGAESRSVRISTPQTVRIRVCANATTVASRGSVALYFSPPGGGAGILVAQVSVDVNFSTGSLQQCDQAYVTLDPQVNPNIQVPGDYYIALDGTSFGAPVSVQGLLEYQPSAVPAPQPSPVPSPPPGPLPGESAPSTPDQHAINPLWLIGAAGLAGLAAYYYTRGQRRE